MFRNYFILLSFCSTVIRADVIRNRKSFNEEPLAKSYTLVINNERKWLEAREFCASMEKYLVSITSKEKNDFLINQILLFHADRELSSWWTSGYNSKATKTFLWNGTTTSEFTFTDWSTEPDDFNAASPDACVELKQVNASSIKWAQAACNDRKNFICEELKRR